MEWNRTYKSTAYNKDFFSGQEFIEDKIKQYRGIKGKVSIQIFDSNTKEKTKEAYTENLIPDIFFKSLFLSNFIQGIMGAGQQRANYIYRWFEYIYLTDYDKPENVKDQRVQGNIIGYAHRNSAYSGDNILRGTINISESSFVNRNGKVKINFVFDFPTHAANGVINSIYWSREEPENLYYLYEGPTVYGREGRDQCVEIDKNKSPMRYWVINVVFSNAEDVIYDSYTSGWILIDGKDTDITVIRELKGVIFPEENKGHMVIIPFDFCEKDILDFDRAVNLLNKNGEELKKDSSDNELKHDDIDYIGIYIEEGSTVFIGCNIYYESSSTYYIRIFKWNSVGVLLNVVDVNLSENGIENEYFKYKCTSTDAIGVDGNIDIVGYVREHDNLKSEYIYSNHWLRINYNGEIVESRSIQPQLGTTSWFEEHGMDSGNISRRCYVSKIKRSKNRVYLFYSGVQGGSDFFQVIDPEGNILEFFRDKLEFEDDNYRKIDRISGTDSWISRYHGGYNNSLKINSVLTSQPIGAHTKLTKAIEKTESNTMKIQYMFEIDLNGFVEDYY